MSLGKYLQHHLVPSCPQAAILQQTAEYIFSLEQEKTRLLQQNTQLKRFIQVPAGASFSQHPPPGSLTPAWAGLDPTTGLGCRWSRRSHLVHRPAYFTACLPARASVSRFVWWSGLWKDHVTVTLPGIWPVCWICRMGPLGGSTCVGQRRGVCRGAHLHGGVSGMGVSAHSPTAWGP